MNENESATENGETCAAGGMAQGTEDRIEDGSEDPIALTTDDIDEHLDAEVAAICLEFAHRMQHARRHSPRHALAAILNTLRHARRAAIADARRNANAEIQGRREIKRAARSRLRLRNATRGAQPRRLKRG